MRALAAACMAVALLAGCSGGQTSESWSSGPTTTPTTTSLPTTAPPVVLNHEPEANLTALTLTQGPAPLSVTFALNASDVDGDALRYNLTFGDGTPSESGDLADLLEVAHAFAAAGNFTVVLNVSDGEAFALDEVAVNVTALTGPLQTFTAAWDGPDNPRCAGQVAPYDATGLEGALYVTVPVLATTWGKPFAADFASFTLEDYILFADEGGDVLEEVSAGIRELNWSAVGTVPPGAATIAFYGCGAAQGEQVSYAAG